MILRYCLETKTLHFLRVGLKWSIHFLLLIRNQLTLGLHLIREHCMSLAEGIQNCFNGNEIFSLTATCKSASVKLVTSENITVPDDIKMILIVYFRIYGISSSLWWYHNNIIMFNMVFNNRLAKWLLIKWNLSDEENSAIYTQQQSKERLSVWIGPLALWAGFADITEIHQWK